MRILIDVPVHAPSLEILHSLGAVVEFTDPPEERRRPLPASLLAEAEILLCSLPPENFEDLRRLRWLQITSAGYSQLYGLDLVKKGIRAANGRGNFDVPIAEWNIAMMVNLARDVAQMVRHQDAGIWDRGGRFQNEIRGRTVGFWGYGGMARETARLAKAMGMQVHVLTRRGVQPAGDVFHVPGTGDPDGRLPDRSFLPGEEQAFLETLDFLVLAMPLTPATEGRIGERELRALKPSAWVLNPARGPLIQEAALLRALREGWIAGAALDTHYHYPLPPDHPLWGMKNAILTPHIAGSALSPHFLSRTWHIFVENIHRYLRGEALLNELSASQLDGD